MSEFTNDERSRQPSFRLNPAERRLLLEKALADHEVDRIEHWIGGAEEALSDELTPRMDFEAKSSLPDSVSEDDIDQFLRPDALMFFTEKGSVTVGEIWETDQFPGVEALWRAEGLSGVLQQFGADFVGETNYGLRNWREIRSWITEMELTPTPTRQEIELACGDHGLRLPSIFVYERDFYDFLFLNASHGEKQERQADYDQVRAEVRPFLI